MPVFGDGFRGSSSSNGGSVDPAQYFEEVLDGSGNLVMNGAGFTTLKPEFGYLGKPNDGNNGLYIDKDTLTDTVATLKNTGDALNAGVLVYVSWK